MNVVKDNMNLSQKVSSVLEMITNITSTNRIKKREKKNRNSTYRYVNINVRTYKHTCNIAHRV